MRTTAPPSNAGSREYFASTRLPEATRNKARFAMQLMCDAFAPSNIPWLNPGVVKEATETQGLSLVRGLQNFLDDVANNGGYPRQVDRSGFELGVNIAATPGRVVPPGAPVRIRADATWSVPEPELALVISPAGKIVGFTVGVVDLKDAGHG